MGFPFRFSRGKAAGGLGTGTSGLGLQQPQTLPREDGFFRNGYKVLKSFGPTAPGYVKISQQFVPVSLVGNGSDIQGQMDLAALARMTNGG